MKSYYQSLSWWKKIIYFFGFPILIIPIFAGIVAVIYGYTCSRYGGEAGKRIFQKAVFISGFFGIILISLWMYLIIHK